MKLGTFRSPDKNEVFKGIVKDEVVYKIKNYDKPEIEGEYELKSLKILPPTSPTKIIAVGLNYRDHAEEMRLPLPDEPIIFLKPPSSVIAHRENIIYPEISRRVDFEAELAIVIKSTSKNISRNEAHRYILGYTAFNDVTARDLQKKDGQWTRAKSFDTFSPFGPFIETEIDPSNLKIQSILNDEIKQNSSTSQMIFDVYELVSFVSKVMTLYPGDVIATGTPAGIGPMQKGDKIVIKIEGLNELENYVSG